MSAGQQLWGLGRRSNMVKSHTHTHTHTLHMRFKYRCTYNTSSNYHTHIKSHSAGSWSTSPGGCLLSGGDGRGVFFNTDSDGSANALQQPVCSKPGGHAYLHSCILVYIHTLTYTCLQWCYILLSGYSNRNQTWSHQLISSIFHNSNQVYLWLNL